MYIHISSNRTAARCRLGWRERVCGEWKVLAIYVHHSHRLLSADDVQRAQHHSCGRYEGDVCGRGWLDWSCAEGARWFTESRGWRGPRVGRGGGRIGCTGLVPMVSPPVLTARTVAVVVCQGISFGGPSSEDGRTDRQDLHSIVVVFVVVVVVFGK